MTLPPGYISGMIHEILEQNEHDELAADYYYIQFAYFRNTPGMPE